MTEKPTRSVPTARRTAQHLRFSKGDDAYEHSCILTLLSSLGPLHFVLADTSSPHGSDATLRVWVRCPRASNGPLPRRSNLVGYVRWHARSDSSFPSFRQSFQQLSVRRSATLPSGRERTEKMAQLSTRPEGRPLPYRGKALSDGIRTPQTPRAAKVRRPRFDLRSRTHCYAI
jgi:hypothetical protein